MAQIGGHAHGVTTRQELLAAGLSAGEVDHRVAIGLLLVEFRGVYLVGHRPRTTETRYMAAVKACGAEAVLSGLAAAWLWGLVEGSPPKPVVTAPSQHKLRGVTVRRRRMHPNDSTRWKAVPITTVPVTLIDISPLLSFEHLAKAVHVADVRHATTTRHIETALERYPKAKGRKTLLAIASGDAPITLSELEKRFLRLLRQHNLPQPETNRPHGAHYVDCRWPAQRLTVELDSYRFHRTRHAWEQDRQRERAARARGDRFRRYTWRDVVEDPLPTLAELRSLLSA
jgi:hypothetical protein